MVRITKPAGERKTEIMDMAERLFAEKGYMQVPVQEILQEVGIAKGTFYHHFTSKEELLQAILVRRLDTVGTRARQVLELPAGALVKLQAVMGLIFASGQGGEAHSPDPTDEKHALMHLKLTQMFYEQLEPVLAGITAQGVREGVFRTADPLGVTQLLLRGITSYVSLHFKEMGNPGQARQVMGVIVHVLNQALGIQEENADWLTQSPQGGTRP